LSFLTLRELACLNNRQSLILNRNGFSGTTPYIERHCASIIAPMSSRTCQAGYALVELPVARALDHAFSWLAQGIIPARDYEDRTISVTQGQPTR
jgi:hypothetical protein